MTKKNNRVVEAILEMNDDQLRTGLISQQDHDKITLRHLGAGATGRVEPIGGEEIRSLREQANLSQAVFARYLNLTPGFVSQLERGTKQPKGPALVLLNLIRHKGLEAIL
jgi:putative transcriptional regulator